MNSRITKTKPVFLFGERDSIGCINLIPPSPITKPIIFDNDFRFLVLDVNASDTDFTHWISPKTTNKTVLDLYCCLFILNRIFYFAGLKCCLYVQQKERLAPGDLLVRKEIVAGHTLYFGFDRDALQELLPVCLVLILMINANYFDIHRIFTSPLCLDMLKAEAAAFDSIKGVPVVPDKAKEGSEVLGSYRTLIDLQRILLAYHRISHTQMEPRGHTGGPSNDQCYYERLRNNMLGLLPKENVNDFATGFAALLSGPFLLEYSFRMTRTYREMKDLVSLYGCYIGLNRNQIRCILSSDPSSFIRILKNEMDTRELPIKSKLLSKCLENAVLRYHFSSVFTPVPNQPSNFCLDLTGGISWEVCEDHMKGPFAAPLFTMVFPREQVARGVQMLSDYIDQKSLENMPVMTRELEAYSAVVVQTGGADFNDVQESITRRQGNIENVARKYPLFVDVRNLLEKLANVLQPGGKVKDMYQGVFAELTGKLIEDAVQSPNKPISPSLEALMNSYPTLVDRNENFKALHLNSLTNKSTGKIIVAVHNPFDDTVEMSDGLLINDIVTYLVATHSQLPVETTELRLAVTSGVVIDAKKIWIALQGPPGTGKSTCVKTVLRGIREFNGVHINNMVREMDSMTTASLKSLNEDPLLHCSGVAFVNELNDGGSDKSSALKDDSGEMSTAMKNFHDSGLNTVYRAQVKRGSNDVRQNVQHVIFDCVFIALANHLRLCPSLWDRMVIHDIHTMNDGDRMTLSEIFRRMDMFKVGHYEILKLFVIYLVSIFHFVGCTLEDVDYLTNIERLVFNVMDQEFRAMHIDANFLGRGRFLDNIRSLVHMLAMHRAVLTVLGCIDTFRLKWEEHDPDKETLEDYNQRMMQLMIADLETMTLHELVRRVQEVYCPSPADYITIVTMQCFDENPHFPMFCAIVRSLVDPTNLENTSDGRKIFVVPNVTYARLCETFDKQRINFERKEIQNIFEAMMTSITREGIPVITRSNCHGGRSGETRHSVSMFELSIDANTASEVAIKSDMLNLVTELTEDIRERITKAVRESQSPAVLDRWFRNQMVDIETRRYGTNANRFFGFLSHLIPNRWASRYTQQVVENCEGNAKIIQVPSDFNHARLKLIRRWMMQCVEDPKNVNANDGYVRVHQVDQCPVLVSTIHDVSVQDTFRDESASASDDGSLLPFYKAGSTVYVHQTLLILRLGVTELEAKKLRSVCSKPDYPIEYWTFNANLHPTLWATLEKKDVSRIDVKYTTTADALVYKQDLDGRGTGVWLHLSLLSRLEDVFSTSTATSRDAAKEFATRCMRRNLTDRKTLLCFNKRNTEQPFDIIKVDETKSARGGVLPRVNVPREKKADFVTASMAMMREGHSASLGITRQRATTFLPQHETAYVTQKYMASTGKLKEIQDHCKAIYGDDLDAREMAIEHEVTALTKELLPKIASRYRALTVRVPVSSVKDLMNQDDKQSRGVKRVRIDTSN